MVESLEDIWLRIIFDSKSLKCIFLRWIVKIIPESTGTTIPLIISAKTGTMSAAVSPVAATAVTGSSPVILYLNKVFYNL